MDDHAEPNILLYFPIIKLVAYTNLYKRYVLCVKQKKKQFYLPNFSLYALSVVKVFGFILSYIIIFITKLFV